MTMVLYYDYCPKFIFHFLHVQNPGNNKVHYQKTYYCCTCPETW